ncbi:MAG: hypothetical protein KDB03_22590, partial [Planctomycetales bacterium]|nr:hypothetical protein [Planctomycetales bacterium]
KNPSLTFRVGTFIPAARLSPLQVDRQVTACLFETSVVLVGWMCQFVSLGCEFVRWGRLKITQK